MRLALKELKRTNVIRGSRLYYWLLFFFDKITVRSKRISLNLHHWLQRLFAKLFSKELTIQNNIGTFTIRADDSIAKSSPYFEHHLQNWLGETDARKGFLDIGANIGFYSLLAINQYQYQQAWAFEANPRTHKLIQQNVVDSELTKKIHTFPFGLGDSETKLTFIQDTYHTGISRFVSKVPELKSYEECIEVPVRTFDTVAKENHIDPSAISFIKIDVEGFEYQVLQGMKETLSKVPQGTLLFIEIWEQTSSSQQTLKLIEHYGFKIHKEKGRNKLFKNIRNYMK